LSQQFVFKTFKMTNFTLHTGRKIPAIAFGTGTSYFNRSDDVIEGIIKAFEAGFRYIDTAIAYGTEEGVGKAVKKLIEVYLFHKN
jgi:diketogulonate reductase-like aldo/keto reductase